MFNFNKKLIFVIILLSILCQSCKYLILFKKDVRELAKGYENVKITHKFSCMKFIYEDGCIYLPIVIDNTLDTVMFDTGSNGYLSYHSNSDTIPPKAKKLNVSSINKKVKLYYTYEAVNVENDLFVGQNYVKMSLLVPYPKLTCIRDTNVQKQIMGIGILPSKSQSIFQINFSDSSLCFIDSNSLDTIGYKRIKSSFERNGLIFIYITIDGVEYKTLFDTGSDLTLGIDNKYYENHKSENDLVFEGLWGIGTGGIISGKSILKQKKQAIYLTSLDSVYIKDLLFGKFKNNNMGMKFISKFDWMFDLGTKTVYVKPIKNPSQNDTKKTTFTYLVLVQKNKLMIAARNLSAKPTIPLNAVIKSVDGVKITPENICHYLYLLNSNSDWSDFQIEFRK